MKLDWNKIKERYKNNPITYTKDGDKFQVGNITDSIIFLDLPCGEKAIRKKSLKKAVQLLNNGEKISDPEDYVRLVDDERSSKV